MPKNKIKRLNNGDCCCPNFDYHSSHVCCLSLPELKTKVLTAEKCAEILQSELTTEKMVCASYKKQLEDRPPPRKDRRERSVAILVGINNLGYFWRYIGSYV